MRILLPLLIFLYSFEAYGQHCGPQDYDSEEQPNFDCPGPGELELRFDLSPPPSIPVRQGQVITAAWDGALVHRDRLLEIGFSLTAVRRLRWLDRLRLRDEFAIRNQYQLEIAEARQSFTEQQRDVYQERARAAESRLSSASPWWRSPSLWFAIGMVVAGGLVALTGWALSTVSGS